MDLDFFEFTQKKMSLVLFIQDQDLNQFREQLQRLGDLPHLKLVVQPCPYEGIEFLYRAPLDIPSQSVSMDREVYWHALPAKAGLSEESFLKLSKHHYDLLVAILQQDAKQVTKNRKALESFIESV